MGFDGLLTCVTEFTEEKHDLQETQTLLNFEDWLIILNNDGLKSGSGYFIYLNMYTINYINLTCNIGHTKWKVIFAVITRFTVNVV